MPHAMPRCLMVSFLALVAAAAPARAQRPDSTLLRPTWVTVTISNDPTALYNGTYTATGISTRCGLADYGYPHRANSFAVEFPDDPTGLKVRSLAFDADTLKAGTTVTSFYLSVGTVVGARGTPPAYVVRANKPQFNERGTAQRIRTKSGADSLTVKGVATLGRPVDVELTLVCQP